MLDLKFVMAETEAVKKNCRDRNVPADVLEDVDRVVELETKRRALLQAVEEVRRKQNEMAQSTGKEKDPEKRTALVNEGRAAQGRRRRAGGAARRSTRPIWFSGSRASPT